MVSGYASTPTLIRGRTVGADDFHPWRRKVAFLTAREATIRPLLDDLDFVEDKSRWGYKFRYGVFEISEHDLAVIRAAMLG